MPPPPNQLAAHLLRVRSPSIAHAAADALYTLRPELHARYGDSGKGHCVKDLSHHLRFLAAAVDLADPNIFTDYATWAARVMVAHHVAPEDAVASFRCLLDVAPAAVPPDAAPLVRDILTRAVRALDSSAPAPPYTAGHR